MMKMKIKDMTMITMKPNTPSKLYQTVRMTVSVSYPAWAKIHGRSSPNRA